TFDLIVDSMSALRKLARQISQFDGVQLIYDGTVSFMRSVFPAVLISRFFGKSVELGYYPARSVEKIPAVHYKIMTFCSNVIVGTRYMQRELARRKVKSDVKMPPIDLSSYPVRTITEVQPRLVVVYDGTEDSAKLCAMLAFYLVQQKYPRTELTIAMSEANNEKMPDQILELLQSGISLSVNLKNESYAKEFGQSDIFLNCSYLETAPLELLAAMAMGLPSISFETYGAREIIENGTNGFLIRHNDHSQLADRIIELIENRELVSKVSTEAAKIRAKFSVL
ncbi:MAG: glycosyltransferase family 4 protein, partial [Candidatus Zixiibacteriota bacterium]